MGIYAGGPGRSTSTNRWRRGRKPPAAIRMALRFPGPGPGDHGPSSGMMGKDSMPSAMNIWEVQCGEVHHRRRNSSVAGCCRQQTVDLAATRSNAGFKTAPSAEYGRSPAHPRSDPSRDSVARRRSHGVLRSGPPNSLGLVGGRRPDRNRSFPDADFWLASLSTH